MAKKQACLTPTPTPGSADDHLSYWLRFQAVVQLHPSITLAGSTHGPGELVQLGMAHYELWLLQRQLQLLGPDTATQHMVTCCMQMLQSATLKAAELAASGHNMSAFEASCAAARGSIEHAVQQRQWQVAQRSELPPVNNMAPHDHHQQQKQQLFGSLSAPQGTIPALLSPPSSQQGRGSAVQRAAQLLGLPPAPPAHQAPLTEALQQLQQLLKQAEPAAADSPTVQHALCSVERHLFTQALAGFGASAGSRVASEQDALVLEHVVDAYRLTLHRFLGCEVSKAYMRVERRRRGVLVQWVAYCMLLQATRDHPVLGQYGSALSYADLQYLVLSDKLAVDAALAMAAYLRQQQQPAGSMFSLGDGGKATFAMAAEYVAGCQQLSAIVQQHQADAQARIEAHWAEVQRKQQQLPGLCRRLSEAQASLDRASTRLAQLEIKYSDYGKKSKPQDLKQLRVEVDSNLRPQVSFAARQVQQGEEPPAPVIQPLPKELVPARQWVFFLHMPPLLRRLARCGFLAQQLLLPLPADAATAQAIAAPSYPTSLAQHCNQRQATWGFSSPQHKATEGSVMLYSSSSVPYTSSLGPSSVESFESEADAVWWPDSMKPAMAWRGSGSTADGQISSGFFNPWGHVSDQAIQLAFTEQLPADTQQLQWAMHTGSSRATVPAVRGNWGVATHSTRPGWLSKPGCLAFTDLRSYPLGQLRRLCTALRERQLPLGRPEVQALVKQAGPAGASRRGRRGCRRAAPAVPHGLGEGGRRSGHAVR